MYYQEFENDFTVIGTSPEDFESEKQENASITYCWNPSPR